MDVLVPLTIVVMAVGPILALIAGFVGRGRVWKALAVVILVIGSAWWADVWLLFATDELDGWIDCHPSCSRSETAAAAALAYLPILTTVILLGASIAYAVRYVRRGEVIGR